MSYILSLRGQNKGFTLVELAISIVIIGLLVAGVSSGTALINQAKLKTIYTEMQAYKVAYSTFRGTYDAIPGDMANASSIFSGCATTASHCNGDGNGLIEGCTEVPVGGLDDMMRAFRHLKLAGLINKGGDTIIAPNSCLIPNGGSYLDPAWGYPQSTAGRITYGIIGGTNGFYGVVMAPYPGATSPFDASANMVCAYRNAVPVIESGIPAGALSPKDTFNLDRKFDDGFANGTAVTGFATGSVRAANGFGTGNTSCIASGNYDINQSPIQTSCIVCYQLN